MCARLSIGAVCDYLRLSRWSVYRLIDGGDLTAQKDGHRVWVTAESLAQYVQRNTVTAEER